MKFSKLISLVTFLLIILPQIAEPQTTIKIRDTKGTTDLQTGLVAFYPFNGNTNDESGNGNNIINVNAVAALDRFGVNEKSYYFDGSQSRMYKDVGEEFRLGNNFTLSVWINVSGNGTDSPRLVAVGPLNTSANYYAMYLDMASRRVGFLLPSPLDPVWSNYVTGASEGWKLVTATYDGTSVKIFIDNKLDVSSNVSYNFPSFSSARLQIGYSENSVPTDKFNGNLDDIRIYNRALTETEINELYYEGGYNTLTYDGKTYHTVQIGTQTWLKENLDVGVYKASTNTGSDHSDLSNNGIIEKYCYDNNEANCATYGGLYDWNEAMQYVTTPGTKGICPTGWHIPTKGELETLMASVGNDGNALKAIGQGTGIGAGTNTSGFSALLVGYRYNYGFFTNLGNYTYFWSSTESNATDTYTMSLWPNDSNIAMNTHSKENGFSVRCLKDVSTLQLNSPNGEETWQAGSTQNITWINTGVTNVKLEYTTNNGSSWLTLIASTPASSGSYAWTIPNTPSTNCKVRISDGNNSATADESDNVFTINGMDSISYGGKIYHTVKIGTQTWLKENLDIGVYVPSTNTGTAHSDVTNNGIIEKYCYDNNEANCSTYGGLYDWNEAMQYVTTAGTKGICPTGWHIPTNTELQTLATAVGNNSNALKAIGQGTGGGAGTNTSGFSALLAGDRTNYGSFGSLGDATDFWSSTEYNATNTHYMNLYSNDSNIYMINIYKGDGFSVRCLKDVSTLQLNSPKGSETWQAGSTQNITWTSTGVTDVKLEFTTNSGTNWTAIIATTPASSGSYAWTVTNTPSTNCKIKVSDVSNSATPDESDNVFTINGMDSITYGGKIYHTVKIGTQTWLKENLDVGEMIQNNENATNSGYIEKYCYDNNLIKCTTYGGLYQWDEAMLYNTSEGAKGICPTGWHIPTNSDFDSLKSFVSGDGNTLKAIGQGNESGAGTNTTGFSGLLAGMRISDGGFSTLNTDTRIWSSTQYDPSLAGLIRLTLNDNSIGFGNDGKNYGFSVRCIKDIAPTTPSLLSPTTGSTNVTLPPTLTWNASKGATNYTLQVSTDSTFATTVYNQSGLNVTTQQVNGLSYAKYYWRVNAVNAEGTSEWSPVWSFSTGNPCTGTPTVTYAGKTYNTIQIGAQCWLRENLDIGIYVASTNTGTSHSDVTNNGIIEKYCYDNIEANCATYGGLYDWNEAMQYVTTQGTQGICPTGWQIPTKAELETLKAAVSNDGNALKAVGQGTGSGVGTNTSGFSALLAGNRGNNGNFNNLGSSTYFWTSTETTSTSTYGMTLWNNESNITMFNFDKGNGFSIRCLKDESSTTSLQITSPNGSETWQAGSTQNITWTNTGVTNVKLEYTTNSGTNWTAIIASTPASSGGYVWTIPNSPSTTCKVKVSDVSNSATADESDNFFTINGMDSITYDGKIYHTVKIGNQTWLKENLDVGEMIQNNENATNNGYIEKYCYDNNLINCTTYGGLYQWDEAMLYNTSEGAKGICPTGWHIPTNAELQTLANVVENNSNALKAIGQGTGGGAGTNTSGFSALLVGSRYSDRSFYDLSYTAYFWSSTEYSATYASYVSMSANDSFFNSNDDTKSYGFSVRCIKDIAPTTPSLLSPTTGSTNVILPPTLTWNTCKGATNYTLQVSTDSTFATTVYNQSGLNVTTQQVNGLSYTKYYWRVNAVNAEGTSVWSPVWNFSTGNPCTGTPTVTYAGKTYNTIQIGAQCWLRENLDIGTMIQGNQSPTKDGLIEKYCYDNNPANCITYGGLYQWDEAMQYSNTEGAKGICPTGWHIPTFSELQLLGTTVGGNSNALKAIGQGTGDGVGFNTSGFSALLAGMRNSVDGSFNDANLWTLIWGSTNHDASTASMMHLYSYDSGFFVYNNKKAYGFNVRCLKDAETRLNLQSPNGSETWQAASTQNITWTNTGVTDVKLEFTTNSGTIWTTIIASTPANSGSYAWTVPNTPSTQCKVRATDVNNASLFDVSDTTFTISDGNWIVYNTSNSSLPHNSIKSIAVDNAGVKWIGTENGLAKFDGTNWMVYTTANSGLPYNYVSSIAVDGAGNKWIGTFSRYLAKFDNVNWTIYNTNDWGLPIGAIQALAIDASGNKWIGTSEGLAKFDGTTGTIYTPSNSGLPYKAVQAIAIDEQGNNWIGTLDSGLVKFDGTNWTVYKTTNSQIPNNQVHAIAVSRYGNKWLGTTGGFAKYDGTSWNVYDRSANYLDNWVFAAAIDNSGNKWTGSMGGVGVYDGANWTSYSTTNSGLPDNRINAIAIDGSENKWFGTNAGGVAVLKSGTTISKTLALLAPNGSENWQTGTVHNITWTNSNVINVKLEYTTNSGANWSTIIGSTSASSGSYAWTVPGVSSANCKIRVSDASNSDLTDKSDNVFTIIKVVAPPTNLTASAGNKQVTLKWNKNSEPDLRIYRVYGGSSANPAAQIDSIKYTDTTKTLFNLTNDVKYYFRITAIDSLGNESGFSNEVNATPQSIIYKTDQAFEPVTINMATGRLDKAETFTVETSGKLVRVDLLISRYAGNTSDLLFDIRSTSGGAPVTSDANTLVSMRLPYNAISETQGFQTIDFSSQPVNVTAGQVLAIVLRSDPDVESYTWSGTHTINGYPYGHHYFRHPSGWPRPTWYADVAGTDVGFRTYLLDTTVPDVTAPSSPTALTAVGKDKAIDLSWKKNLESDVKVYRIYGGTSATPNTKIDSVNYTDTTKTIANLTNGIPYYYRITAVDTTGNESGFSNEVSAVPNETITYGGKIYHTIKIGNQTWLKENLDVGVYVASLSTGGEHSDVSNNGIIEKYCYDNNEANCSTYGGLYDWNEAMQYVTIQGTQGICPTGWHIPTNAELQTLANAVGNNSNALKAVGQGTGAGAGTNTSGFSALLAGFRSIDGYFGSLSYGAFLWSSTEGSAASAGEVGLGGNDGDVGFISLSKSDGFSVRCLKGENPIASLQIISPNGGESFVAGTVHTIEWTSTVVTNVKLEYTTNSGTNWATIIASTPASSGSYPWTIPNTPSTQCEVKISDVDNASIADTSGIFIITAPVQKITVTSPNGGERWRGNTTRQITWGIGSGKQLAISSQQSAVSSRQTAVGKGQKVSGQESVVSDEANGLSGNPPKAEKVKSGKLNLNTSAQELSTNNQLLTTNNSIENVRIDYSTNNGVNWTTVANGVSAAQNSYTWLVPKVNSQNCKVRVVDQIDTTIADTSDAVFEIYSPQIAVTSPNGGEQWQSGSTHAITWTQSNTDSVKISYSTNQGTGWIAIAEKLASEGTYSWVVPSTISSTCKVKISDKTDSSFADSSNAGFAITAVPVVQVLVTSPNGGENWKVGSAQNITWTSSNVSKFKIEYKINSGVNWTQVGYASSSPYSWNIPNTISSQCKVRVSDSTNAAICDSSDAVFTIFKPTLTVVYPNGGEELQVGSNINVTWLSSNVQNVAVEYSTTNKRTWSTISASVTASNQSISWTVPDAVSDSCFMRIKDVSDNSVADTSDAKFKIIPSSPPSLTLTSPVGNEQWKLGTKHFITWTKNKVTTVKIEFSSNDGSSWSTLTSSAVADSGKYEWTVPNTASTVCRIKISDADNALLYSVSPLSFELYYAEIVLTAPNGGEEWMVSETHAITWTSLHVNKVKVELTTDNGANWTVQKDSAAASIGNVTWVIPNIPATSTECKIKISDANDPTIFDVSEQNFTIKGLPKLQVISPKAGDVWEIGTTQAITWYRENIEQIKIELSTNGSTWMNIASSVQASDQSYNWEVQNYLSQNCLVRISDVANPSLSDTSDVFSIVAKVKPVVLTPNGGEKLTLGEAYDITWKLGSGKLLAPKVPSCKSGNTKGKLESLETAATSNIRIQLSTDDGVSWATKKDLISVDSAKFTWTVDGEPSDKCFIKIVDINDASNFDLSDSAFVILDNKIPNILVSTNSLDFGNIYKDSTEEKQINITNTGTADLQIQSTSFYQTSSAYKVATFNQTIKPDSTRNVSISFKPTEIASYNDTLYVYHNAAGSPVKIALTGSGIEVPKPIIKIAVTSVTFDTTYIGSNNQKTIAIDNEGTADLVVTSITTNKSVFSPTEATFTVGAGLRHILTLNFTPTSDSSYSGTLSIQHNAVGSPSTVSLVGQGKKHVPNIVLSSKEINFGVITIYTHTEVTLDINNSGTAELVVSNISSSNSGFATNLTNFVVQPNSSRAVTLTFSPINATQYTGTLTITHNAGAGVSTVSMAGAGYPVDVIVTRTISFGDITLSGNYRMVGLPGDSSISISKTVSGTQKNDWNAFYDNGVISANQSDYLKEYDGSAKFAFKPGNGFWVVSKNGLTVSANVKPVPLAADSTYSIPLQSNWNIISNPFEKSTSWTKIKQLNGLTTHPLYKWNGQNYDQVSEMTTYEGFYFYNTAGLTSLKIPYDANGTLRKFFKSREEYQLGEKGFSIDCRQEGIEKSSVYAGFNSKSSNDVDDYDYFMPPADFGEVSLVLQNDSLSKDYKKFLVEQRKEIGEGTQFDFTARNSSKQQVQLSVNGIEFFPESETYLLDKQYNKFTNLKEKNVFTLPQQMGKRNYALLVGSQSFIQERKAAIIPTEYLLYQNFPNPFNPATTIAFGLPKESNVTLTLYNMLGEVVFKDELGSKSSGYHELLLDLSSKTSGVYFYAIQANALDGSKNFSEVKKMMLLK